MKIKCNNHLSAKLSSVLAVAFLWFAFLFSACENEKPYAQYYPVDSLIDAQVKYLGKLKFNVKKVSRLGEVTDTTFLTLTDSAAWSNELDIFRQIDELNKPINKGVYTIASNISKSGSKSSTTSFTSSKKHGVAFLKLYFDEASELRKLEAGVVGEHSLYKSLDLLTMYQSARILTMEFTDINNESVLSSYAIQGGQKMDTGDTVEFFIQGTITR